MDFEKCDTQAITKELHYELDGIYCARCGERLGWVADVHNCIVCYCCGEYNSCICDITEQNVEGL